MFLTKRLLTCFAAGVVAVWTTSASAADPALSFSFSDLAGNFSNDGSSWLFTAADHAAPNATSGAVTRLVDPLSVAGFDSAPPAEFFSLEMTISAPPGGLDPANFLSGDGLLTVTDVDDDTISINTISGIWINSGSSLFVATTIQNLAIASDDGEFNGTSGMPVSLNGLTGPVPEDIFNSFSLTLGNWFTNGGGVFEPFSGAPTLAVGRVVPEPATLCLLAFGTLVMAGRFRRRA